MHYLLDLKLLVLLGIANGVPVFAQTLLGKKGAVPLDGMIRLPDGQPLLGLSKTIRGVVFSLLAATAAAALLGMGWKVGLTIGAMAMAGDLFSSFVKRRLKAPVSSMAIGLDQIPESLFPLLAVAPALGLSKFDIASACAAFLVTELALSRVLFRLHLRDKPY